MKKNSRSLHLCPMKAGQILASVSTTDNEFDLAERERIRWALIDYMKAHKIGVPTLASPDQSVSPARNGNPAGRRLQRTLGPLRPPKDPTKEPKRPTRTHDMALIICKAFVEKLPNKPTAMSGARAGAAPRSTMQPPGITSPGPIRSERMDIRHFRTHRSQRYRIRRSCFVTESNGIDRLSHL